MRKTILVLTTAILLILLCACETAKNPASSGPDGSKQTMTKDKAKDLVLKRVNQNSNMDISCPRSQTVQDKDYFVVHIYSTDYPPSGDESDEPGVHSWFFVNKSTGSVYYEYDDNPNCLLPLDSIVISIEEPGKQGEKAINVVAEKYRLSEADVNAFRFAKREGQDYIIVSHFYGDGDAMQNEFWYYRISDSKIFEWDVANDKLLPA